MTNSNDQNANIMTKALAVIALLSLSATLLSTLIAIWGKCVQRSDLLDLTKVLLDWKIIAGGLVIGGGKEIKKLINKFASYNPGNPSGP